MKDKVNSFVGFKGKLFPHHNISAEFTESSLAIDFSWPRQTGVNYSFSA